MSNHEKLPDSAVIFQKTSVDGLVTLRVWRDAEPETNLMREVGGMGTLQVYSTHSGELYHEERLALSASAILGPGPTPKEVKYWDTIMSLFLNE